jgi:dolichol-phosphate mannosyltransferase
MGKTKKALWVVMPAYNEEKLLPRVLDEWLSTLRETVGNDQFVLVLINDGSKDQTLSILRQYAQRHCELMVIDKPNSGHGQSCIEGYRFALRNGAQWVFQIDSDGQCDPQFFPKFWELHDKYPIIYGHRRRRDDGIGRRLISSIVSLVIFGGTGVWVRDPNVPYRLMHSKSLAPFIETFPSYFHLANVFLAYLQSKRFKIYWVDIRFRQRFYGASGVNLFSFIKQGYGLWMQIQRAKNGIL